MTDSVNVRELVLDMLQEVTRAKRPSHVVHSQMLEKYQYLEKQERKFLSRLFKGTLERMLTLDYVIGSFSSVKVSKIKPVLRDILRMSVYQLLYMSQIPDSAVCNEAVKLAGKRGFHNLKGFVNGVLRNICRNKENLQWPDRDKNPVQYLSVMYSAPEWLVTLWLEAYGTADTETMLRDSLEEKPVTVRCVDEKNTDRIRKILEDEGVHTEQGQLVDYALRLSGFNYLNDLPGFQKGWYTVQDESSMMVVEMAGLKGTDTVIDVCAAPGGKSCHAAGKLLSLCGPGEKPGHVYSRDLTPQKTAMIEENCRRLGLTNMTIQVKDAAVVWPEDIGRAQVVLADLPCSGLGVMGKKPDIKYRMTPEQMQDLVKLQRTILDAVHNYVMPGGVLIYSTCTVNPAENIENARWFESNYDFVMDQCRQYRPGIDDCDGFFIARFVRNKNTDDHAKKECQK